MIYEFNKAVMATPAGAPQNNKNNNLCKKLGTSVRTGAYSHEQVTKQTTNFRTLFYESIAIAAVALGIWAAAWSGCAVSDICYAAQGGMF